MHSFNYVLIYIILLICSVGLCTRVDATPNDKGMIASGATRAQVEVPDVSHLIQEHKITLSPFYLIQRNGSNVWVERILVTFTAALQNNSLKYDFDNPTFRKVFYNLMQSGESETIIQAQSVAELKRQIGMNVDPNVQISRSVLVMR